MRATRTKPKSIRRAARGVPAKSVIAELGGSAKAHESLQSAALTLLKFYKIPATALYTGPRVRPRAGGGFDLRRNRSNVGISDIMACLPPRGLLVLIECKTGRARRTPEQIEQHNRFRAAGAHCFVIRTVDDLRRELRPSPAVLVRTPEGLVWAVPGVCRKCGCTESRACDDGCAWADDTKTICTSCA
jgi:hypothetical protein